MTSIGANTNNLLTLDSFVRTYLTERAMVWHDYLRVLAVSLSGVRDLSKDINIGSNIKAKELEVDQSNAVYLPSECVKVFKVCIESGDKILGMAEVGNINPLQKFENGVAVKRPIRPKPVYQDIDFYYRSRITERGEFLGRDFGVPEQQPFAYQVFGNRIQLDSMISADCVLVLYITDGTNMTDINMIHPWAEEALKLWVDWKFPNMERGIYEKRSGRKDYYDAKAALYGAIHGIGYEDYMKIVRDYNVLTYKT